MSAQQKKPVVTSDRGPTSECRARGTVNYSAVRKNSNVLHREHFAVSRAAEYFSITELQAQTGQPAAAFWHVALKELVDNALDAAETSGREPAMRVEFERTEGRLHLEVSDNGNGIPAAVVAGIPDFGTRTSDKAAYLAPTRGAQGNALKTLIGMPVTLGDQTARLAIRTQDANHALSVWITPAGEVRHEHTDTGCDCTGTRVTVDIPERDYTAWSPAEFVNGFALFNPHAKIQMQGIDRALDRGESGEPEILNLSFEPNAPARWRKFTPSDLTSASWYTPDEFARLTHLKESVNPALMLRDFAREFRGQPRRWRAACNAVDALTIGELIEIPGGVETFHHALQQAPAPNPDVLGRVGMDHFRARFDALYSIKPDRYWYKHRASEINGAPFIVEVAIAETEREDGHFYGLNFSVPFGDPLAGLLLSAGDIESYGIANLLTEAGVYNGSRAGRTLYTVAAVHLVMPRLPSLDRGKSRLALSSEQRLVVAETIVKAAKTLREEWKRWERQQRKGPRPTRMPSNLLWKKEAVESILLETYMVVTENEALYISARDMFYAIRPKYNAMEVRASKTGTDFDFNYFSQIIIPAFRRDVHALPMIDYKARGVLYDPHNDTETPIGDKELRDWKFPEWTFNKLLFIEKQGVCETLKQVGGRDFARRWDIAVICSEGYSTAAVRKLMALAQDGEGYQLFVWHDADPDGYNIARTLAEQTARIPNHSMNVFDLGLFIEHAIDASYQSETFTRKSALPSTLDLDDYEQQLFGGKQRQIGYDKYEWHDCVRVEINAIPIRERIAYLEERLSEIPDLLPKVQPPPAVLKADAVRICKDRIKERIADEVDKRLDKGAIVLDAVERIGNPDAFDGEALTRLTSLRLIKEPAQSWRDVIDDAASLRLKRLVPADDISDAVNDAIEARRGAA